MIGDRVLLPDRVQVGVEKTFYIELTDHNGNEIENLSSYTLTCDLLKPDGTTEVAVTPTLVANTAGKVSKLVSVILTAANCTPAGQWLLNLYGAAPSGNAQPIDRAFVFYVRSEWE